MSEATQDAPSGTNISASSVAKATAVFSCVAGGYIVLLWGSCFLLNPSRRIINRLPWQSVKDVYARSLIKAENLSILKKIPQAYRGPFAVSFAEMLTVKVIIGPAALPFKVWLTYEILKYI